MQVWNNQYLILKRKRHTYTIPLWLHHKSTRALALYQLDNPVLNSQFHTAKHAGPVIGRLLLPFRACLALAPEIPVSFGRISAFLGLQEPFVLAECQTLSQFPHTTVPTYLRTGMVKHHVHHHLQSSLMNLGSQILPILYSPIQRVDLLVIGDIITLVFQRGYIYRCQPDHVHSKPFEVVKSLDDAAQVASSVVVAVLKRLYVDLVDDDLPPPLAVHVQDHGLVGIFVWSHGCGCSAFLGDVGWWLGLE